MMPNLGHVSFLRISLSIVVAVDLLSFFLHVGDARAIALANGIGLNTFDDLFSGTAVRAAVVLIGVAAAVGFGRRPGCLWQGVVALGALSLLSTVHAQLFGSPWRHLYYSGVCLSGWLLGLLLSRRRGMPTDESFARVGCIALLGAAYLNAGISKLVYGGIEWISGTPIQAVIVAQDGLVPDSILSVYRSWVVTTPAVASFFSVVTLVVELAGPLMLVGRRTRFCVAAGLFAMHANIYVLTAILYWQSMLFLALFGWSPDQPSPAGVTASPSSRSQRRTFAALAALLALGALLAILHQWQQFASSQAAAAAVAAGGPSAASAPSSPSPAPPATATPSATPPPTATPIGQVGPFAVGLTLATGWTVDALTISDKGFIVACSGKAGRVKFELTCSASEHRSPFDLGAAHIFYSNDLSFDELEEVGWAVQALVQRAAAGGDICERLALWRESAQGGQ